MSNPEKPELYSAHLPAEYLSRGTGEEISMHEATALDFMPRILGAQFMTTPSLRRSLHLYGRSGSFIALEEGYQGLAEDELTDGNLPAALNAYKKAIHNGTFFVKIMSEVQNSAAFNSEEVDKLRLAGRYTDLETKLVQAVVAQKLTFNLQQYPDFVREVREREKEQFQLKQLFFNGKSTAYGLIETPAKYDPTIGRECIDLSLEMLDFNLAAWIAHELGYIDEERQYIEGVGYTEIETPKEVLYLDMVSAKYLRN